MTASAAVVHTSAPTHHHYTTLGLDSRKVAIWAFIGSECMLFASLISTYLIYKGRSLVGPFPHERWTDPTTGRAYNAILNIPVTSASTFVLLMSSLFMVLALAAVLLEAFDPPPVERVARVQPVGVAAQGALIVWLWCNAAPDDRDQDGHEADSTKQAGPGSHEND